MSKPTENETKKNAAGDSMNTFILSGDPNTALRQIISTIEKLQAVYEQETSVLKETDSRGFLAIQDQKIEAIREYQSGMSQILSRKNELKKADPDIRAKLKTMHENFSKQTRQNLEALSRMKRCTERLGNTLRHAAIAAAQQQRTYSYTPDGGISGSARDKVVSSGLSETA